MPSPDALNAAAVNVHAPESAVNATTPSGFVDLDERELDALMNRIGEAREHGMALSAEDYDLLASAVMTLATLQERLSHSDLTILKLKKLLGMVNASEALKNHPGKRGKNGNRDKDTPNNEGEADGPADSGRPARTGRKNPRRNKAKKPPLKPRVHHHGIEGLNKGDTCPGCRAGVVYKYHPATLLRIVGHAPFSAEQHVSEQLRCSACHEIFSAELPAEVRADGRADQTYGYSARALMGIARYFAAQPFHRQEAMQNLLGSHISASTIYDQCEKLAEHLKPVFVAMLALAANARLFYLDDTTHRILIKQTPPGNTRKQGKSARTGVYSSACLAILPANDSGGTTGPPPTPTERRLVLYRTSVGHGGEWFDEILDKRDSTLAAPTLMSDALSSNHVTSKAFVKALCNAHGRRGFAELAHQYPHESLYALEHYAGIWRNDGHCDEQGFNADQRQAYHQSHSLPLMAELKRWCESQCECDGPVEPNSNLGRAMAYFVRHYEGLTTFCRIPGAPIDNNEAERMVKLIVRGRRNSQFFKSENGAQVSDIITSVLATCHEANIDAMAYLTAVQANQLAVRAVPQNWMPWNYPGSQ